MSLCFLTTPFPADRFSAFRIAGPHRIPDSPKEKGRVSPDSDKGKAMRVSASIGTAVLTLGLLFPAAARAQNDNTKAELEALKKRVAALESKQNSPDDSLRKAVERISGPTDFRVFWDDGLRFETEDKAFTLHIGGRLQYDSSGSTPARHPEVSGAAGAENGDAATARLGNQPTALNSAACGSCSTARSTRTRSTRELEFGQRAKGSRAVQGRRPGATPRRRVESGTPTSASRTALIPNATMRSAISRSRSAWKPRTEDNFTTFMERGCNLRLPPGIPDRHTVLEQSGVLQGRGAGLTWAIGEFRPAYGRAARPQRPMLSRRTTAVTTRQRV